MTLLIQNTSYQVTCQQSSLKLLNYHSFELYSYLIFPRLGSLTFLPYAYFAFFFFTFFLAFRLSAKVKIQPSIAQRIFMFLNFLVLVLKIKISLLTWRRFLILNKYVLYFHELLLTEISRKASSNKPIPLCLEIAMQIFEEGHIKESNNFLPPLSQHCNASNIAHDCPPSTHSPWMGIFSLL